MKKKKLVQIITLVAALTVFTITALASSATNNGYETLKDTLGSMKTMDNGTITMNMEIVDNGENIANIKSVSKTDHENKNMSGAFTFTVQDTTKSIEMYKNDETNIIVDKINDLYYQVEKPEKSHDFRGRIHDRDNKLKDKKITPQQEALLDFFVGDLKDNFSMTTLENGNKTISFSAKENDIPVPINLMISVAASHDRSKEKKMGEFPMEFKNIALFEGMEEAHHAMPELKEDIKILDIQVDITLDSNEQIVANAFMVKVEGKDAEGMKHEIMVKGAMTITDVNQTEVDTIDVSNKKVTLLDFKDFEDIKDHE